MTTYQDIMNEDEYIFLYFYKGLNAYIYIYIYT